MALKDFLLGEMRIRFSQKLAPHLFNLRRKGCTSITTLAGTPISSTSRESSAIPNMNSLIENQYKPRIASIQSESPLLSARDRAHIWASKQAPGRRSNRAIKEKPNLREKGSSGTPLRDYHTTVSSKHHRAGSESISNIDRGFLQLTRNLTE